jgi:hypothetical protein
MLKVLIIHRGTIEMTLSHQWQEPEMPKPILLSLEKCLSTTQWS